jgi:phosphoserine phosphatase
VTDVLVLTVSGQDQSGVTAGLTEALSTLPLTVRQLEQIVLQGHLVLGVAVQSTTDDSVLEKAVITARAFAESRQMQVDHRRVNQDDFDHRIDRIIVTVLGSPLVPSSISAIAKTIASLHGNIDRIRQVANYPVTAVEFEVGGVDKLDLREKLAKVARANEIDIAVQDAGLDRRGIHLVVMDVDSTFIQDEVIDLLAARAGVAAEVSAITDRAMNGELDFEQSLRLRVSKLKGLKESAVHEILDEIKLTPGAATLCRTLNRLGFHIALVSGGFSQVVAPLAARMGVEHYRANELEIIDGLVTGNLVGPIIDRAAKAKALKEFAAQHEIPMSRTVAIGDGANDLDMLHAAALGIAFNAKPFVRDSAHASVNTPYLDTVLFVLGITRDQIERADEKSGKD